MEGCQTKPLFTFRIAEAGAEAMEPYSMDAVHTTENNTAVDGLEDCGPSPCRMNTDDTRHDSGSSRAEEHIYDYLPAVSSTEDADNDSGLPCDVDIDGPDFAPEDEDCTDGFPWVRGISDPNKRKPSTDEEGYVLMEDIKGFSWYVPTMTRAEAETVLMVPANPIGSFLIRDSETRPGCHALSVLDWATSPEVDRPCHKVRHYLISKYPDGTLSIEGRKFFKTLAGLVMYHSKSRDSLRCRLTDPCTKRRTW